MHSRYQNDSSADGFSRGVLLEGVLSGQDMISFVDQRLLLSPPSLAQFHSVLGSQVSSQPSSLLSQLSGLLKDVALLVGNKIRMKYGYHSMPRMESPTYLWAPPTVITDLTLEERLKAVHK